PRVVLGEIAHHAAIFERQAVGIFEVDRLSPAVIDDVGGLDAFGTKLIALLGESSRRTGLERKMIEAGRNTEPAVDARIVIRRHARNVVRFHKGDELIVPDIEKDVSKASA